MGGLGASVSSWWARGRIGYGAGTAAKKALDALMERGMRDFNETAAGEANLYQSLEDAVVQLVREVKRTEQELLELARRIEQECGLVMRRPYSGDRKHLFITRPDGTPRF